MTGIALALDGSVYSATAALLRDGSLLTDVKISEATDADGVGRGEALVPLIAEMLEGQRIRAAEIGTVICGAGPGSFTSLRVAASVGKGVAFAARAKMYAVSSLLLTLGAARETLADGNYLSVLPAMRGDVFALAIPLEDAMRRSPATAYSLVAEEALPSLAKKTSARIIGPGREIDAEPHARGAARLYASILESGPIDLDSWEPDYGRLAEAQVKWEALHGRPLKA